MHNFLVRIDRHLIFFKEWQLKGIRKVKYLKYYNNNFLTLKDKFKTNYNLNVRALAFYGIVLHLTISGQNATLTPNLTMTSNTKTYLNYQRQVDLCKMKSSVPSQSKQKWLIDCNARSNHNHQWDADYLLASKCMFKCIKSVRHIELKSKLVHYWKIKRND